MVANHWMLMSANFQLAGAKIGFFGDFSKHFCNSFPNCVPFSQAFALLVSWRDKDSRFVNDFPQLCDHALSIKNDFPQLCNLSFQIVNDISQNRNKSLQNNKGCCPNGGILLFILLHNVSIGKILSRFSQACSPICGIVLQMGEGILPNCENALQIVKSISPDCGNALLIVKDGFPDCGNTLFAADGSSPICGMFLLNSADSCGLGSVVFVT